MSSNYQKNQIKKNSFRQQMKNSLIILVRTFPKSPQLRYSEKHENFCIVKFIFMRCNNFFGNIIWNCRIFKIAFLNCSKLYLSLLPFSMQTKQYRIIIKIPQFSNFLVFLDIWKFVVKSVGAFWWDVVWFFGGWGIFSLSFFYNF